MRAIVSGGYDIPADQADIRAALVADDDAAPAVRKSRLFAAGYAGRAEPQRRRRSLVVMARGARDRSRNQEARCDRARRAAAAAAGADRPLPRRAIQPAPEAAADRSCRRSSGGRDPRGVRPEGGVPPRPAAAPAHSAGRAAAAADRGAARAGPAAKPKPRAAAGADAAGRQPAAALELARSAVATFHPPMYDGSCCMTW